MLPGGGLAGAAEDPALLCCAGLKRETPDRPEPGVPQALSEGTGKLTPGIRVTCQDREGWLARESRPPRPMMSRPSGYRLFNQARLVSANLLELKPEIPVQI